MASHNQENANGLKRTWSWLNCIVEKTLDTLISAAMDVKKLGFEDPRRIIHSLKVGFAMVVVSSLYYADFFYDGFGVAAMWAVMTVVVVFEFSVGATLGRGVNRGIATLLGGALGVAVHRLASFAGEKAESIILCLSVFFIASMVTFFRFFPRLKARYDYALLIFILTFSLISVSGYRDDEILEMAHKRLSTVVIGCSATVLICTFICPIWAGEDLHKLVANNIEKLGIFLEGFGTEYFDTQDDHKNVENKLASLGGYKTVLRSNSIEDALVNFAKWEPRHGKFRYWHPWDQYLKVAFLTRECAYRIDALNSHLNSEIQTPIKTRRKIQESCTKMSSECSYALKELALGIKTMTCCSTADPHIVNAKTAAKNLKSALKNAFPPNTALLDIIPAATITSLLIEIVSSTVKLADCVHELASLAKFRTPDEQMPNQKGQEKLARTRSTEESHIISIVVD